MVTTTLSDKYEEFSNQYLIDLNATKAYQRTYPKAKPSTARINGSKLLAKENIQKRISELKKQRNLRVQVDQDRVLREWERLAFSTAADFREDWENLKPWDELIDDEKAAISEVKITKTEGSSEKGTTWETTKTEFKIYDKTKALDALSRHTGIYEKDNRQQNPEYDLSELTVKEKITLLKLTKKAKKA